LKEELRAQSALAKEGQLLKSQLESGESRISTLQAKVTEMANCLSEAKMEIKTLSTKLAASRSSESAIAKAPGSAMKAGGGGRPIGQQEIVQAMQMKEYLYGDLTGLIVRGVKHEGGEDIYDCIQTGRNGSKFGIMNMLSSRFGLMNENSTSLQAVHRRRECIRYIRRRTLHVPTAA
jgi:Chromosome segregation protein Csm1/Pcs1